jgi:hypothetical protein
MLPARQTKPSRSKLVMLGALVFLVIVGLSITLYGPYQAGARGTETNFSVNFRPGDHPKGFYSAEFEQWFASSFNKDRSDINQLVVELSLPALEKGTFTKDKQVLNNVKISIHGNGKTTTLDLKQNTGRIETHDYQGQTLLHGVFESSFTAKVQGRAKDQVFYEDSVMNMTVNITALPESGLVHIAFVGGAPSEAGLGYLAFGNLTPTPELVRALTPKRYQTPTP